MKPASELNRTPGVVLYWRLNLEYRDHGPREARSKCRLAHLIEDWGIAELHYVLCERLIQELERAGEHVRQRAGHEDYLGCDLRIRGVFVRLGSP
jgi:sulfite reductase beta subunit-like hemoprotein